MKRDLIKTAFFAFCMVIGISSATAQTGDKSAFFDRPDRFYADPAIIPIAGVDSVRIVVAYRFSYSSMVFKKRETGADVAYGAYPLVTFEIRDSNGIIKRSAEIRDTVEAADYATAKSREKRVSGVYETKLPAGRYELKAGLETESSREGMMKVFFKIDAPDFGRKISIGNPIFAYEEYPSGKIKMCNMGGDLMFSSDRAFIYVPCSFTKNATFFRYEISPIAPAENAKESAWPAPAPISGESDAEECGIISLSVDSPSNGVTVRCEKRSSGGPTLLGGIIIESPGEGLTPGLYKLKIMNKTTGDSASYEFGVSAENPPMTLSTAQSTIAAMKYILTEEEYSKINSGSKSAIFAKALEYWKKLDPTPETAYNEAMFSYYERADYAFYNFKTFSEKDGSKTDRGKIYMLNGKPDSISLKYLGSKRIEAWRYDRLKKTFNFEIQSSGVYKLDSIDEK